MLGFNDKTLLSLTIPSFGELEYKNANISLG
jgi:hypothetical protein